MQDVLRPDGDASTPRGHATRLERAGRRNHPSLKDMAADHIREGIVGGRLGPGSKVDQDQIANELGMSRLPVREALIELAAKGFVTSIPRRGSFVVELTVDDVHDDCEVLGMLFAMAARRAVPQLRDAQLLELRQLHDEIAATTQHPVRLALNYDFFRIINEAGSSERLLLTLRFLALSLSHDFYSSSRGWAATEATYRERTLDALDARDASLAATVSEEHLRACATVTIDELRSRGYWSPSEEQR